MSGCVDLSAQFAALRPPGGFNLIMADPPWRFKVYSKETGLKKSPQNHYDCMTLDDIAVMPVETLAADDCVLWLWATNPMLPQAIDVLQRWGFEFKTAGTWSKRNPATNKPAFGTGYILRCASEPFLIGTRGNPKTSRTVRTLIEGKRREHSRKPDEAFDAAVQLMPEARRLELFSRQSRPGWATWGHEAAKFDEVDA